MTTYKQIFIQLIIPELSKSFPLGITYQNKDFERSDWDDALLDCTKLIAANLDATDMSIYRDLKISKTDHGLDEAMGPTLASDDGSIQQVWIEQRLRAFLRSKIGDEAYYSLFPLADFGVKKAITDAFYDDLYGGSLG